MWIWLSEFARETFLHGLSFHNGLLKTLAPRSPHMLTHLLFCCLVAKSLVWLLESPWTPAPLLYPQNLSELAQTHANRVSDAIQPSHPLLPPSPSVLNLSPHQGLLQWVGPLHNVTKVLELQHQHQFFQWIFRVDFLLDWLVWSPSAQGTPKNLI